jgi:hypothetical protein
MHSGGWSHKVHQIVSNFQISFLTEHDDFNADDCLLVPDLDMDAGGDNC